MANNIHVRPAAARAFVRSLNILLKFARMYDFGHPRTTAQYETAWSELRTALGAEDEVGLLLAVSGDQLLLDGTPLESAAAEKGFARMLSAAGIASIHFSPKVTQGGLARFVRAFPTGNSTKPQQLAEQLKLALQGDPHIHVNEVCFVPADSAVARSTVAAQLAAHTLNMNAEQSNELLNDPQKLLQLIIAAEGSKRSGFQATEDGPDGPEGSRPRSDESISPSRWGSASSSIRGHRTDRGGPGSMTVETGLMTLQEDEVQGLLHVLGQIARANKDSVEKMDASAFQSRLSALPRRARFTLSEALSALAAQAPSDTADKPTLLKLAEHIAVRFAVEKYESGDVKIDVVRKMLDEMNHELSGLRKILGVYEQKISEAGLQVQSPTEILSREFWSQVPEEKKKEVLQSSEAWCITPVKLREFVDGQLSRGETQEAEAVLRNYAACIRSKEAEARRQTAMGLAELASLYAARGEKLLVDTIRETGVQLGEEADSELQSLVSAAFVRLSQEAANKRSYPAMQRSVELVEYVESERPGSGRNLRPRIAVESRLPEFIEESLKSGSVPSGLKDLLRRMPQPAAELIAARFGRVGFREDGELLISMMEVLGPEGIDHLRSQLKRAKPTEAIDTVGVLARMDIETVDRVLPARMKDWTRAAHDRLVRQIAGSGSPARGRLLLDLFDNLDSMVLPMTVDEIGMSGEQAADARLLRIVEGELPKGSTEYLRIKAIEALGRLRSAGAETVLRKVVELRRAWRWAHPSELRLVATQALEKINAEWVKDFMPRSELSAAELLIEPLDSDPNSPAIRQRRYARLRLEHPVQGTTTNLRDNCHLEIPEMALGGGIAICEQNLHPGSIVELRFSSSQKPVKVRTIVRDANTQARAFEVVEIDLEERAKLRKLLVELGSSAKKATPRERTRRSSRTFFTSGKN